MVILKKCLAAACLAASLFVVSCRNGQELAIAKGTNPATSNRSDKPQFLDNVTLGGSESTIKLDIPKSEVRSEEEFVAKHGTPIFNNSLIGKYASLLGIVPTAITNYSLYNFIDEWYGTRYRLGGTDKSGIDCSAFAQQLYEQVFCTNLVRTAMEQFKSCKLVFDKDELKEGDLVFFKIRSKRISHVGIYLANNFFVHASASQGVMISSLTEGYWQRFFAGAGKILASKGNNNG